MMLSESEEEHEEWLRREAERENDQKWEFAMKRDKYDEAFEWAKREYEESVDRWSKFALLCSNPLF